VRNGRGVEDELVSGEGKEGERVVDKNERKGSGRGNALRRESNKALTEKRFYAHLAIDCSCESAFYGSISHL